VRDIHKQEDRPRGAGPLHFNRRCRSEILVGRSGGLVDGILGGFLGVAHGLLALADRSLVVPLTLSAVLPIESLLCFLLRQNKSQPREKLP
jgi:hypothetical protein